MRRRELLSSNKANDGRGTYNNYEYVDLQLTGDAANLMFATYNVGATSETTYGRYYQYGKGSSRYQVTSGQSAYSGTESPLALSADTARQVMGGLWRMPTRAELQALTAQTNYQWTTINGENGGKFSKTVDGKERYVFFPSAGYYDSGSLNGKGSYGGVWSSTPYSSSNSYNLGFNSGGKNISSMHRNYGRNVRGVFKMPSSGTIDGYEYVDLGLPSGLKWAKRNVGAATETAYGNYYQWGAGSTKYANTNQYHTGGTDSTYTLPLTADTARQVMGGDWRMPTRAELQELTANTTYTFTTINGVNCGKFTSKINTNVYVFFPAAGYYNMGSLYNDGSYGYVLSSTPNGSSEAFYLNFTSGTKNIGNNPRSYGRSVRGVHA